MNKFKIQINYFQNNLLLLKLLFKINFYYRGYEIFKNFFGFVTAIC